jgi:molybdopterin synthase sulfur carrier subunit
MTVDIALFAYLSDYQPDGLGGRNPRPFDIAQGTVVADIIKRLGLPDEPRVVFINGKHAPDDALLSEGDRLAIFPPVAGG